MEIKLIVVNGKHAGKEIPIPQPKFVIGRDEDCHLRPNSDQVSRRHCEIVANAGSAVIRDFGSKNGTFVNEQRVQGQRELKTGDHLRIANLEFEVLLSTTLGGKKKPKVQSIQDAAARTVQSAAGEDLDVSEWLNRLDNASDDTVIEEIRPTAVRPAVPEKPNSPSEERKDGKRSLLFKPSQGNENKPAAGTSRDAAADVLKNLFGNK
jgi:pSer/pThr/pTyr-binding forkhead associated (FHA) protein